MNTNTGRLALALAGLVAGVVATSTIAACLPDEPAAVTECAPGLEAQYLSNADNETVLVCNEPDPADPTVPAPVPAPEPTTECREVGE